MLINLNSFTFLPLLALSLVSNVKAADSPAKPAPSKNKVITTNSTLTPSPNSTLGAQGVWDPDKCDLVWYDHNEFRDSWYNEYMDSTDNTVANGLCCDCGDLCTISVERSLAKNWAYSAGVDFSFKILKANFDVGLTRSWGETSTTSNSWETQFPGGQCKFMWFESNYIHLWGEARKYVTNRCNKIVEDSGWQRYDSWIPQLNPDGSTRGTFGTSAYKNWQC